MEINEIERLYGEKPIIEEEFQEYHSPKDWISPENDKFNNTVGIIKAEANDHSPAFKFGFIGKTPEWLFKNIIDNTNSVHKKVNVGTKYSSHTEEHVDWQDKQTEFIYLDFNLTTNTLIVALSVWYSFHIETGYNFKEIQKFFGEQMKYHFDIEPENVTMLSLLVNEKVMAIPNKANNRVLTEMEKLKRELNSVTEKINK